MTPKFESIEKDALALPERERELLAEKLLISLTDASTPEEIEEAWFQIAEKRYTAYKEGTSEVFQVKEIIENLRKKFR